MMKLFNFTTKVAIWNLDANWVFTITGLNCTALMFKGPIRMLLVLPMIWAIVADQLFTLNLNRPDLLGVTKSDIINSKMFYVHNLRNRSDIELGWESHFLHIIGGNDCTLKRIAIIWVIVHSDSIIEFRSIYHCNFRKYGLCCPIFQCYFILSTFLGGIICEQRAVTSNMNIRSIWLAEFEMSILITFVPTDVCESAFCKIFTCQGLVNIELHFLIH